MTLSDHIRLYESPSALSAIYGQIWNTPLGHGVIVWTVEQPGAETILGIRIGGCVYEMLEKSLQRTATLVEPGYDNGYLALGTREREAQEKLFGENEEPDNGEK